MSSEKYEVLQDDLDALLERIEASLTWLLKKTNSLNELQSGLARCQRQLDEGRSFLTEMEREARSAPLQYRSEMLSNVRGYRESVSKIQSDIRKRQMEITKDKLTSSNRRMEDDEEGESTEEVLRQQVLRGTNVLEKTSDSIQRSTQVAHETEEIGEAIMGDLTVQREGLERARTMLSETDAELSRSRRILKRMSRGTIYNKVVLILIIIVQICIICALVYWKWFTK